MELLELIRQLSEYELTVQEQARTSENDPTLTYPVHFPIEPVGSVKLADIEIIDARVIGDRREWNADGRFIPADIPKARLFEMVPLEAWFAIGEREIQHLGERFNGNAQMIIDAAKARITQRVSSLTDANVWALEWESIRAWTEGKIVVMNPQTGLVYEVSMQIDAARYVTDTTAWTSSNAFDRLVLYAREARNVIGTIGGIRVREDIALKIAQSAPRLIVNETRMTLGQVERYLSEELGTQFRIVTDERAVKKFTGSGNNREMTKLFPENKVAFIPTGNVIGRSAAAPIFRAQDLTPISADEEIDVRGQRIFYNSLNSGKAVQVQAQWNVLALPTEQNVFVVNITQA